MSDKQTSGNLFESLVILANSLREKGFKAESMVLDEKIRNYKTAEIHLYNTFDETGEDLLDQAHPDGEIEMAPSAHGYGIVQTQSTQHKKIVDMVNKTPTGKVASKRMSELGPKDLVEGVAYICALENREKTQEIVKQTAMALGMEKSADWWDEWKANLRKGPDWDAAVSEYKQDVGDTWQTLPLPPEWRSPPQQENKETNEKAFNSSKAAYEGVFPEQIQHPISYVMRQPEVQIQQMKENTNEVVRISEEEPHKLRLSREWINGNIIALIFSPIKRADKLRLRTTDSEEMSRLDQIVLSGQTLINRAQAAINDPGSMRNRDKKTNEVPFNRLKRYLGNKYYSEPTPAALANRIKTEWVNKVEPYLSNLDRQLEVIEKKPELIEKRHSLHSLQNFSKIADGPSAAGTEGAAEDATELPNLPSDTEPEQGTGAGTRSPEKPSSPAPATKGPGVKKNPSVYSMQQLLVKISDELLANARALVPLFPKTLGDNKLNDVVRKIQAVRGTTAPSPTEPYDGLWGTRTDAALRMVNSLWAEQQERKENSLQNKYKKDNPSSSTEDYEYLRMSEDGQGFMNHPQSEVTSLANENNARLEKFLGFLRNPESVSGPVKPAEKSYKMTGLKGEELVITDKDLASLKDLYIFMQKSGIAQKAAAAHAETIAKEYDTKKKEYDARQAAQAEDVKRRQEQRNLPPGVQPPKGASINKDQVEMIKKAITPQKDHWQPLWAYGAGEYSPGAGYQMGLTFAQWTAAFDMMRQLVSKSSSDLGDVAGMLEVQKKLDLIGARLAKYLVDLRKSNSEEQLATMKIYELNEPYETLTGETQRGEQPGSGKRVLTLDEFVQKILSDPKNEGRYSDEQMGEGYRQYLEGMGYGTGEAAVPMNAPPITPEYINFAHPLWTRKNIPRPTKGKLYYTQVEEYQFDPQKALQMATGWYKRLSQKYPSRSAAEALQNYLYAMLKEIDDVVMTFEEQNPIEKTLKMTIEGGQRWKGVFNNISDELRKGTGTYQAEQIISRARR